MPSFQPFFFYNSLPKDCSYRLFFSAFQSNPDLKALEQSSIHLRDSFEGNALKEGGESWFFHVFQRVEFADTIVKERGVVFY